MIEPIIKLFSCPLFSPLPIKHPRGLITLYLMGGIQNTNINTAYTSHGQDNIVFWIKKRYNIFSKTNLQHMFSLFECDTGRDPELFLKDKRGEIKIRHILEQENKLHNTLYESQIKTTVVALATNPLFSEHCSLASADIIQWWFNRRTIERKYSTMAQSEVNCIDRSCSHKRCWR